VIIYFISSQRDLQIDAAFHKRRVFAPKDNRRPSLDLLYWEGVGGEHHIDQKLYNEAQIIIATSCLFQSDQDCLRQVQTNIKKLSHRKGFNQDFKWQHTTFTQEYLKRQGFMNVSISNSVGGLGYYYIEMRAFG
jgi:hypothetical protein